MTDAPLLDTLTSIPPGLAAYSVGVVFLGYVVLGTTGFGSALTIVPLLALRWPLFTVVPQVLLLDLPAALLLARLNMSAIAWRELALLGPGMVVGAALGVALARWSSQAWGPALLGAYIMGVALVRLSGRRRASPPSRAWALLAGAAAGVIESLFGTCGPVIVAWLSSRLEDPQALRANIPVALAAATAFALAGMAVSGQLAQPVVWASLPVLLLVAFAGTRLGHHIAGRLPPVVLARFIYVLLACAGGAMLVRAFEVRQSVALPG